MPLRAKITCKENLPEYIRVTKIRIFKPEEINLLFTAWLTWLKETHWIPKLHPL